jgi:hypothetical protein
MGSDGMSGLRKKKLGSTVPDAATGRLPRTG